MGMAYAFPKNPDANYETSINLFKTLIREYPESVFINQAKIWKHILDNSIKMEKEIDKKNKEINLLKNKIKAEDKKNRDLTNQIKRLKEIDLGIEEKKRKILPENGQ
jgi:peptidoglycan hydrolase CwlO-like protein